MNFHLFRKKKQATVQDQAQKEQALRQEQTLQDQLKEFLALSYADYLDLLSLHVEDVCYYVGENEEGRYIYPEEITCICFEKDGYVYFNDEPDWLAGAKGQMFYTRQDAKTFMDHPDAIPKDYGKVDYSKIPSLLQPGTRLYTGEDDFEPGGWLVMCDEWDGMKLSPDGKVYLSSTEHGLEIDLEEAAGEIFLTYEGAEAYCLANGAQRVRQR